MKTTLYIGPDVKNLFIEQGLDSFDAIYASGEEKVERLVLGDGEVFFQKRIGPEPNLKHVSRLIYGYRPRSGALRELQMLQVLRKAGFLTMEPVVWGEQRRFGRPLRGLLIVREVPGEELAELFDSSDGWRKRELMKEAGRLIGRLHVKGLFQPVRLKDVICSEQGMVLIDRETSKPRPSLFLKKKCLSNIARAARRTMRDGHRIGGGSAAAFLRGYQEGVSSRWIISIPCFRKDLMKALRREMG